MILSKKVGINNKIENYFYYFIIINGYKVGAIVINDKNDEIKKKFHLYTYCLNFKIKVIDN